MQLMAWNMYGGAGSGVGVGEGSVEITGRRSRVVTHVMLLVDWPMFDGAGIKIVR